MGRGTRDNGQNVGYTNVHFILVLNLIIPRILLNLSLTEKSPSLAV